MAMDHSDDIMTEKPTSAFERQWHYKPDGPIGVSPLFAWPPQPRLYAQWVKDRWFAIAENSILLILASLCYFLFQPSLEDTKSLAFDWILLLYGRNLVLMIVVAGGLHLWFHHFKKQGQERKYDPRELKGGRKFTFNSQVRDNIFWTLASGVTVWTAFEVLMFWLMGNGYIPVLSAWDHPIWFLMIFLLTPIWISFHFYWIHRALHWPPLYRIAHALHHRNTNVGPWSGLSMHPIEHILFFSSILIHALLAAHPIHILFHMQHQALTAATSHTGFEGLMVKDKNRLALGTFHHQMHHRYFECNYGNLEMPWDKWFGSFHDGTEEAHARMQEQRKLGQHQL